jgi:predicted RNA polymerase sigma factor
MESRLRGLAGALTVLDPGMEKIGPVVSLQLRAVDYGEARGDVAAALKRLDSIINRANRRETWLEQKGDLLRRAGRTNEAVAAYQSALDALAKLSAPLQASSAMLELRTRVTGQIVQLSPETSPIGKQP